jgi:ribosomal protein L11
MPKKIKKPINRKTKFKNKNVVSVKINIDNSRKTTARRTTLKPSNMQPFVNFPSH